MFLAVYDVQVKDFTCLDNTKQLLTRFFICQKNNIYILENLKIKNRVDSFVLDGSIPDFPLQVATATVCDCDCDCDSELISFKVTVIFVISILHLLH